MLLHGELLRGRYEGGVSGAPVAGGELAHRALPGAPASGADAGIAELAPQPRPRGELQQRPGQVVGIRPTEEAGVTVLDQRRGPTFGDGHNRQTAGGRLEDDLAISVGTTAEEEGIGTGVGARQVIAGEPAEEGGPLAKPLPQLAFLGTAAGEQQVQTGVRGVGAEESLGQQVDPLFAGQTPRVEDLDLAGEGTAVGFGWVEALDVDAALPAAQATGVSAEGDNRGVGGGARGEDRRRSRVEGAEPGAGQRLQGAVATAHPGVSGDLGVVAGEQRHAGNPAHQRRRDPGRSGGGYVDEVIGALRQGLDQVRQARDAEGHPFVEGDLQLRRGGQAAVDAGVGADDVDVEAGDAALANLFDRVGDPMHRADPVGDHRNPLPLPTPVPQLRFLGAEESGGRRIRHRRYQRLEEPGDRSGKVTVGDSLPTTVDRLPQTTVMPAPGPPVQISMGEPIRLQVVDQLPPPKIQPHSVQPSLQQSPSILRPNISSNLPLPGSSLPNHPFGHLQHSGRIRTSNSARGEGGDPLPGPSPLLSGEGVPSLPHHKRSRRQSHSRMSPLSSAALFPMRFNVPVAHMPKKLFRRRGRGRLGEGAADVDAGMVVGTADAGAAVGLDVDGGGHVQLGGP